MNKRKLLTLAMALCMVAILAIGGTLAYFTDTDAQTNVFAVGNVKIDLFEDFNTVEDKLVPSVFKPAPGGNDQNGYGLMIGKIEKEVYIENEGNEDAYVRVHIAVPQLAEKVNGKSVTGTTNEEETIDASEITKVFCKDILGLTREEGTTVNGKWNWSKSADNNTWAAQKQNLNTYEVTINDIDYTVYVGTYETKLGVNETTCDAISDVYMHPYTTSDMITWLDENLSEATDGTSDWSKIYVVAEAVQAEGFGYNLNMETEAADQIANADKNGIAAFEAMKAAFGEDHKLTAEDFLRASEGDTFKEATATNGN